jgi:ZIP family zinc transporter/zinc and cadmium transporter
MILQAIAFTALAAMANIAGGALIAWRAKTADSLLRFLTAFGAGFMLAVAFLEMLPGGMEVPGGLTAVLIGYLAVHLTQHVLTPHFHFGEETHEEAMISRGVGVWALVGLIPHAFFDGVAISGGFLASADLGILISLAVLLHKVPTGVSLASIMLASGNSRRRAIQAVAITSAAMLLGALVTPAIDWLTHYGFALAAGVTIYVAASNLIPESQREHGWSVPGGIFLGVGVFYILKLMLPGV